jgi:ATP-dependent Clp protease adapter protein ClpS
MTGGGWRVVLWDDDVNTVATAAFVLHRVVGLPLGRSLDLPVQAHERGTVEVAVFPDREDAEVVVARMLVFGVHGGVIPA